MSAVSLSAPQNFTGDAASLIEVRTTSMKHLELLHRHIQKFH
jgi:hypothetical protein